MAVRMRFRYNVDPNTEYLGKTWTQGFGGPTNYYASKPFQQTTYDELHKRQRIPHTRRRIYLSGGPLTAYKTYCTFAPTQSMYLENGLSRFEGKMMCNRFGANPNVNYWESDSVSMTAMGTKGIAKLKPGNPAAGLGQFLVELRQLPNLPKVLTTGFSKRWRHVTTIKGLKKELFNFKQLGSEYLNYEFGWKPFLRDLRELFHFQEQLKTQLDQLRRDNGKMVRRRGTITRSESTTYSGDTGISGLYPALTSGFYDGTASAVHRRDLLSTSYSRYWFSGAFRYWIPDIKSAEWPERAKLALLGINPTPKLLWDVLPWSWLIDWFSSVGDVIDNMSTNAAENLVVLYGYSMGHKKTVDFAMAQSKLKNVGWVYATQTRESYVKRRVKASPFGFDVNLPNLSDRQVAILSALGLSKRSFYNGPI